MSFGSKILKHHSSNDQLYYDLIRSLHTEFLSLHMAEFANKKHKPDTYSLNLYDTIAAIKSANAILIVIFAAMKLAGITDEKVFQQTKNIILKLGRLIQAEVFHRSQNIFCTFDIELFIE